MVNQNYNAVTRGYELIDSIPAKVYFMDLLDRDESQKYEWTNSPLDNVQVLNGIEYALSKTGHVGIPRVVITMPHFTRIFRWGSPRVGEQETNIHPVGEIETSKLLKKNGIIIPESTITGCVGEIVLLAEEAKIWSESKTIGEYLETFHRDHFNVKVEDPNKLSTHLGS